jgi:serine/threonine-protein kinase SBK
MKYIKDKWLNSKQTQISVQHASFRVAQHAHSDHDSVKYINHKESRRPNDEKTRLKRLMSTFGIHQEKHPIIDEAAISEIRVSQWLQQNELNFKRFHNAEEDLDLSFWEKDRTNYYCTPKEKC